MVESPRIERSGAPGPAFDRAYANRALVLLSVLAAVIVYIDVMLIPSLPTIAVEYHVSIAETSLLISLYTTFGVAMMPIVGKLGDIYGKRRVLLGTLVAYLAVATTTSFAPTFGLVLASRFFQGVGLGVFPLAFSMAREEFPRTLVPRAQGLISAVQVAGGAMGILAGAIVTGDLGWQANYHLALPCIAVLTVLVLLWIRESPNLKPGVRLDLVGALALGGALTAIVLGLSEGATWGWSSAPILGLLAAGFVTLVPLARYERHQPEPVLDLRLLRQRNVLVANLLVLVYGISGYVAFQAVTYYLQLRSPAGFGLGIVETGLALIPLVVVLLPVAYAVGTVIPRYGVKPFLVLGAFFGTAGFLLLAIATTPVEVALFLCAYAVGSGLMSVAIQNLLVLSLAKGEMGLGTSLNTSFRYIGQSVGAPLAGAILSTFVTLVAVPGGFVTLPRHVAFQYCFYVAGVLFVAVAAISLFAKELIGRHVPATPPPTPVASRPAS